MERISNYVGGEWMAAASGRCLDSFEPATGQAYACLPDSDAADVQGAIEQAQSAFAAWSTTSAASRAQTLRRIADGIEARHDELAEAESRDNGKPVALARALDVPRAAANFRFFADAISQCASESHITDAVALNYTLRAPLGVVGCISPWNLPLYLLTWKVAPALAAGNTVVAKPSEVTPMTAHLLAQICHDARLPPGVLNIVHGTGLKVGAALVSHEQVAAISFTGSTQTGQAIARVAAPAFKKLSLELGGKNPTVVFEDADFDQAVNTAVRSAFANQGQICLCGSRIFVQRRIYERFKTALAQRVAALKVGDPLDPGTDQGAVVSQAHHAKIMSYLDLARQEGGQFLTGGAAATVGGRCAGGVVCSAYAH